MLQIFYTIDFEVKVKVVLSLAGARIIDCLLCKNIRKWMKIDSRKTTLLV